MPLGVHHTLSPPLQLYAGYVDDPRNTDNSWMETVAFNFHDDSGKKCLNVPFVSGFIS